MPEQEARPKTALPGRKLTEKAAESIILTYERGEDWQMRLITLLPIRICTEAPRIL